MKANGFFSLKTLVSKLIQRIDRTFQPIQGVIPLPVTAGLPDLLKQQQVGRYAY